MDFCQILGFLAPYRSTICISITKHGEGRFVYLLPLFIFEFKMLFILFLLKFMNGTETDSN